MSIFMLAFSLIMRTQHNPHFPVFKVVANPIPIKKNYLSYNKYREFPMDNRTVKFNDHVYFIRTFIAKELIFKGTCNITPLIILNVYQVGFY